MEVKLMNRRQAQRYWQDNYARSKKDKHIQKKLSFLAPFKPPSPPPPYFTHSNRIEAVKFCHELILDNKRLNVPDTFGILADDPVG